jgi:hypothetical protein
LPEQRAESGICECIGAPQHEHPEGKDVVVLFNVTQWQFEEELELGWVVWP